MGVRLVVQALQAGKLSSEIGYRFAHERLVIGRTTGADVQLPDPTVSHVHATLRATEAAYVVVDEASTNGTWLNEAKLAPHRPMHLRNGDVLRIGTFRLLFAAELAPVEVTSSEATASLARRLARELMGLRGQPLSKPCLQINGGEQDGERFELPEPPAILRIGRGEHCDVVLRDQQASREHAAVTREADGIWLRDLGSKNPSLVNGKPVEARRLQHGDLIELGQTSLRFVEPAEEIVQALLREPDAADAGLPVDAVAAQPASLLSAAGSATPSGPATRSGRRAWEIEVAIYVFAALLFSASLAGLWMLLGG